MFYYYSNPSGKLSYYNNSLSPSSGNPPNEFSELEKRQRFLSNSQLFNVGNVNVPCASVTRIVTLTQT